MAGLVLNDCLKERVLFSTLAPSPRNSTREPTRASEITYIRFGTTKRRPREDSERAPPSLEILAWQSSAPVWPELLDSRFEPETGEYKALQAKRDAFLQRFPPAKNARPAGGTARGQAGRVGGMCDYAVDAGAQPLDVGRDLSVAAVPDDDFSESRQGSSVRADEKIVFYTECFPHLF